MAYRVKTDERGNPCGYTDTATGEQLTPKEYNRRMQMQQLAPAPNYQTQNPALVAMPQQAVPQYQVPQFTQPIQGQLQGQMQPMQPIQTMQPYQDMVHYPGHGALLPTDGVKVQPKYTPMPTEYQMNPYAQQMPMANQMPMQMASPGQLQGVHPLAPQAQGADQAPNPLIQPGARILNGVQHNTAGTAVPLPANSQDPQAQ